MSALLKPQSQPVTMTSLEIVAFINDLRKEEALVAGQPFPSQGHAKLEHADFLKKVPLVLGEDYAGNFSETVYRENPSGGGPIPSPGYRFPKREASLMAMNLRTPGAQQPAAGLSGPATAGGLDYIVLRNVNGVLAVYRVLPISCTLKRLKRWPKGVE